MDHCVPICAGVLGTCLDGVLYSLSSTKRAFTPYFCSNGSSSSHTDRYSAINQYESQGLLDEGQAADREEEDNLQRRHLEWQERSWANQGHSSKAGKVLGINAKARRILGLSSEQQQHQPRARDGMRVDNEISTAVFDADDA